MLCISVVSKLKSRNSEWLTEKSTHNFTDSDYSSNHRRSTCKKYRGNTIVRRFSQSSWLYTQREDGSNTACIWSSKRNRYRYNDVLQKYENGGSLTRWQHRHLRHCHRKKKYRSAIYVYNLPWQLLWCLGVKMKTRRQEKLVEMNILQ